jgi:hypothetical protein
MKMFNYSQVIDDIPNRNLTKTNEKSIHKYLKHFKSLD